MYLSGFGQAKVVRGTPEPTSIRLTKAQRNAVGAFVGDDGLPFCTGALVSPHVVLTAAHCGSEPGDKFVVGDDALTPDSFAYAADVVRHPSWSGWLHDHALVLLDRDVPVEPMSVARSVPAVGQVIQGVGYGLTAVGASAQPVRWWVEEPVTSVEDGSFTVSGGGERGLCNGDSGGPAIVMGPSGPAVAGTVSQGELSCVGEDIYSVPDADWISAALYGGWTRPGEVPISIRLSRASVPLTLAAVGAVLVVGLVFRSGRKGHSSARSSSTYRSQ